MPYRIELTRAAERDLDALPNHIFRRIDAHIRALAKTPRPHGVEKLAGRANRYRIRVSAYRVIYEIHDPVLVVLVVRIGHRREIYR